MPAPEAQLDRILDAAYACFTRHGVRRTTMDDLAREAGMSRPAVYRYVQNKEDAYRRLAGRLYAGALACVLPSLEEGFGLAPVEAAACGTPCIATTRSPLPELLAGGGFFVEPEDEAGLAAAIARLAGEPGLRARLGEAARERAAKLSWAEAAAAARAALHAIARRPGR